MTSAEAIGRGVVQYRIGVLHHTGPLASGTVAAASFDAVAADLKPMLSAQLAALGFTEHARSMFSVHFDRAAAGCRLGRRFVFNASTRLHGRVIAYAYTADDSESPRLPAPPTSPKEGKRNV